jgi:zinc protease
MNERKVFKKILANGLTVLAVEQKTIPKVSLQLWYNVGSKDELSGEKGIAHLIEHMIFKGTEKLSESDINMITQKLSGYCNAFTSHDYTGYLFDFPSQNWREALPLMADCMTNCTFNPEMLASELKAVIQELKMYNDDFGSCLVEKMLAAMFPDHPYHNPIIGYKQDLWNLKQEALVNFYKKHYVPNNATLIGVGDIDHEELFAYAEKHFGPIAPNYAYKKPELYHSTDIARQHITLYRDIKMPIYLNGWVIPGLSAGQDYISDIFCWVLASGMGSRLYTKLVNNLQLATDIDGFVYDLFDKGVFFISCEPSEGVSQEEINKHILAEITDLAENGLTKEELQRATSKAEMVYLSLLESTQKQAYSLGKYYLALGDENYLYNYSTYKKELIQENIKQFAARYLREAVMYTGSVLELAESEQPYYLERQELSDKEDSKILASHVRTLPVEPGRMVHSITAQPAENFPFPTCQQTTLSNGIRVLYYHNPEMPKVELVLDLKAKHTYDPKDKQGLLNFVADMLLEGTERYDANQLAQIIESYGISLTTAPGRILMTMLAQDLEVGLDLLTQILTQSRFEEESINKIRKQLLAEVVDYWDTPTQFIGTLAREALYQGHPYSKNMLGSAASLKNISTNDLRAAYKQYVSPHGATLVIVGNLEKHAIKELLEKTLSAWQGPIVEQLAFPSLAAVAPEIIDHTINRDQIVLGFCGLSVERTHPDYDKLLLFDQIFTGGVLGSMNSRLFSLREESGLFYTIGGSLVTYSDKQPGMVFIKTIVSPDRLTEAEVSIARVIDTAVATITDQEFTEAKQAIINSLVDNFATNKHTAIAFLFLDMFRFGQNYFSTRAEQINSITKEAVQEAVARYLDSKKMVKIRIGRLS